MLSFRGHAGFILSSYKEYIHQGSTVSFKEYFDIENDTGILKRDHFLYKPRVEAAEKHFEEVPFVFLLDEIKTDLAKLLAEIAQFIGAEAPDISEIDRDARNTGVNYYQSLVLRRINNYNKSKINPDGRFVLKNQFTMAFKMDPRRFCQYWLFFLPDKGEFFGDRTRSAINEYYQDDWEYVKAIASARPTRP